MFLEEQISILEWLHAIQNYAEMLLKKGGFAITWKNDIL